MLLKNVPPEVHTRLKRRAARTRRSLNQEATAILKSALRDETKRPTLEEIRKWQVRGASR